jgi:hypothetical protein
MLRPIVVLGMHRGGTSLVGDLIHRWGAYAGNESKLLLADENNQQGYWEYVPLINFNDNLLNSVGSTWLVPPGTEAEETLRARASEAAYKHPAEQLVQEMRAGGKPWFWKDPRLTVLLPFWKRIWSDAVYAISVRHPLEIAMSVRKRDHVPLSASLLIWQQYMLQCLRHTEDSQHRIFIKYENLIQSPLEECRRLDAFLNRSCGRAGSDPNVLDKMMIAVRAGLRHNRSRVPFSEEPQATAQQKVLDQILTERAEDRVGPIEQAKIALYPGWKEYLQTFAALSKLWQQFRGQEQLLLSQTSTAHREVFGL